MKFVSKKTTAFVSAALSAGFIACSDSSTKEIAGGVTDIGNSLAYTGVVVDQTGANVASARVVAYYDSWEQTSIVDSVETITDANGKFEILVDSGATFVLFASHDNQCGYAKVNSNLNNQEISIGSRKNLTSSVNGKTGGFMRVVGNIAKAPLQNDGSFEFNSLPPGDISLVYVEDETPQARLDFTTTDTEKALTIPALEMWNVDSRWLTIGDARYYTGNAYGGINVFVPAGIKLPEVVPADTMADTTDTDTVEVLPADTNSIRLHMDGDAVVYNNDNTVADSVNYVEGISGKGILLAQGQFVELKDIDPSAGDFTISLWTNWKGPTDQTPQTVGYQAGGFPIGGYQNDAMQSGAYQGGMYTVAYQVLFAQRSYWSDSTSRFQMQYDPSVGRALTVVSNGFDLSTGYAWLAKADVEYGGVLPVDTWTFLSLVYQDGKLFFYVNGELVSSSVGVAFAPSPVSEPVPFRIGGTELASDTWNGAIDEVTIDFFARSAESVKAEYAKFAK